MGAAAKKQFWTCPVRQRSFKHRNQMHSCARVAVETHLANKSPQVTAIFEALMTQVSKLGEVTVTTL